MVLVLRATQAGTMQAWVMVVGVGEDGVNDCIVAVEGLVHAEGVLNPNG